MAAARVVRESPGRGKIRPQGKRTRPDVADFLLELEGELVRLQGELESGTYRPGPYRTFTVHDPKPRRISAAPFRDRVVHHALTRVLQPIFERRFAANLKYVWIPPGSFEMGCSRGDNECADDEKPAHQVTISKAFWMGQAEVTVAAYQEYSRLAGAHMETTPALSF